MNKQLSRIEDKHNTLIIMIPINSILMDTSDSQTDLPSGGKSGLPPSKEG